MRIPPIWFRRHVLLEVASVRDDPEITRLVADAEQLLLEGSPLPHDAMALDMAWRMHAAAIRDRERIEQKLQQRITVSLSLAGVVVATMGAFGLSAGGWTIGALVCLIASAMVAAWPLAGFVGWPGQLSVVESLLELRAADRAERWLAVHIDIFCSMTRLRINQVAWYLTVSTLLAIIGVALLLGLVL